MPRPLACAAIAAALFAATPASGHVTVETPKAPAGSYHKVVLRLGHGCDGSPTTRLRVRLPEGVTAVKPQPKPGWDLEIVKETLDPPQTDSHGRKVSERVSEVAWSGRLLDAHYDEFAVRVRLPDRPGDTLYFPTVQECEAGIHRWIEIPEAGRSSGELDEPAPRMILTP